MGKKPLDVLGGHGLGIFHVGGFRLLLRRGRWSAIGLGLGLLASGAAAVAAPGLCLLGLARPVVGRGAAGIGPGCTTGAALGSAVPVQGLAARATPAVGHGRGWLGPVVSGQGDGGPKVECGIRAGTGLEAGTGAVTGPYVRWCATLD